MFNIGDKVKLVGKNKVYTVTKIDQNGIPIELTDDNGNVVVISKIGG